MEPPTRKKARLTDHFRIALKPRDLNVQIKKKEIQVVTISDDEDENENLVGKAPSPRYEKSSQHQSQSQSLHIQPPSPPPQPQPQPQPQLHLQPLPLSQLRQNNQTNQHSQLSQRIILNEQNHNNKLDEKNLLINKYAEPPGKNNFIVDFDRSCLNNIYWEPHYAWESFDYDKQQEILFQSKKYILIDDNELQHEITPQKRAQLVDWLVEIQMRFSLDHEPLYMAVKLVDQYMMRKQVSQEEYQLLYMTAILISAKFDERVPPLTISDLLHLSRSKFGNRFSRKKMVALEVDLLSTLNFNIRFPLSYGFLRRFARCTRSDVKTLNLARYILELSLMDYDMIEVLESKMAAGSLLLALEMLNFSGGWDDTAKFYTGYDEQDLHPLVVELNDMILRLSQRKSAIRKKYSHESFMEVARIPPLFPEILVER